MTTQKDKNMKLKEKLAQLEENAEVYGLLLDCKVGKITAVETHNKVFKLLRKKLL